MRHAPHNGYKWILHVVDHWSKFHFAYPLVSKSARDVANALEKWVFPVMGLPSILPSDNGWEFVKLIEEVIATWPVGGIYSPDFINKNCQLEPCSLSSFISLQEEMSFPADSWVI